MLRRLIVSAGLVMGGAGLFVACAQRAPAPPPGVATSSATAPASGQPAAMVSAMASPSGSVGATPPSGSAVAATSSSAGPAAKVDPCEELRGRLGSSDAAVKKKAAIEAGKADCSETFYDQAVGVMIEVAKTLSGDDDSVMLAADTLCIHTRHPATRKRTYDVYTQYLDRRFADGVQARARDRYRSRDCYLALKPGTDTRLNR